MDLSDPAQRQAWIDDLGTVFAGRRVIAGIAPLAGLVDLVPLTRDAGADGLMFVANGTGAGPVPSADDGRVVLVEVERYPTMTEELRAHDHLVRDLPDAVRAEVDDFDPDRKAVWLVGPFVANEPIEGRDVVGGRRRSWIALEDKIVAEEIWSAVGAAQSPYRVVPADRPDLLDEASAALDAGSGVVWSGDARDGFNGGGEFVRWVTDAAEREAALAFFAPRCDRVRVMPFLEGVPCSIHGMVLPDGTAVFRPVELAILRDAGRRFVYGGQGTSWDPADRDREEMRDLVRRTGEHLRERADYRGAFGIDGVMTADGFRPTELNPRFSGGLNTLARGVGHAAFSLLQYALVAGRDPGVSTAELELWALAAMDAERVVKPLAVSDRRVVEESLEVRLSWDSERLRRDDGGQLTLVVGPSAAGTFAKLVPGRAVRPGERVGPLNVALMRFLDEELGTGFGPVEAAPDVR